MATSRQYSDPSFNEAMKRKIREKFEFFIKPHNVISALHKYNHRVLKQKDIDEIKAKTDSKGDSQGASLLLDRLAIYEGWFECLLDVLRDPFIEMGHVADSLEEDTETLRHGAMESTTGDVFETRELQTEIARVSTGAGPGAISGDTRSKQLSEVTNLDHIRTKQLIDAAMKGDTRTVRELIKIGVDVNCKHENNEFTPLMYAAGCGHVECLLELLKSGGDVRMKEKNGDTALSIASFVGHTDCVAALLEGGSDVNHKKTLDDRTPLMWAAMKGHVACLRLLLSKGADMRLEDTKGDNALSIASWEGSYECVGELITAGSEVNHRRSTDGVTPLMLAAHMGHMGCVRLLLSKGADIRVKAYDGITALGSASWQGHTECVKEFIKSGSDLNNRISDGRTPLMLAAEGGHVECLRDLLTAGADVRLESDNGRTALEWAAVASSHKGECERILKQAMESRCTLS